MATFNYVALTKQGKQTKGTQNGDSERAIRRSLKEQGLTPLSIKQVASDSGQGGSLLSLSLFKPTIKPSDLALILRQLATLLHSGLTLDDSLKLMAEQSDTAAQKALMLSWHGAIVEGQSLSSAMNNSPQKLPQSLIAAIAVGEETGHLDNVLARLADEQENVMQNQQTLKGAMVYPAMIITVALGVLIFVMVKIVPQVTEIFTSQQAALPRVTVAVIGVSNFLINYGIFLAIAIIASIFGFNYWLRTPENRMRWHKKLLNVPTLGHWILISDVSDWCRGLAVLLGSGVPAVAAMNIATAAVKNLELRQRFGDATEQVRQGSSIHQALVQQKGMPGFMLHMVGSGEAGSELDSMLMRVAEYYANVLKGTIDTVLKLVNPILLILISLVVMAIIFGVLTPIMQMNQMI